MEKSKVSSKVDKFEQAYTTLKLQKNQALDMEKVKKSYITLIRKFTLNNAQKIKLNTAYEYLSRKIFNTNYSSQQDELIHAVIQGNVEKLKEMFNKNQNLVNFRIKGANYPLLYIAVRSGHYEVTRLILKMGCSLDFSKDRSTPMHCAACFGHYHLIPLLLENGIPIKIKNFCDSFPIDEAATSQIKELLQNADKDQVHTLITKLIEEKIFVSQINIEHKGNIIAKKIILNNYFKEFDNYVDTFHGTYFGNFFSIAKHGLKKPGDKVDSKTIQVVKGHFQEGRYEIDKKDWAVAVFVSPSPYYAGHPCYAKETIVNGTQTWLPIIQAKVKKGSYTTHPATTRDYHLAANEPSCVQFRVGLDSQVDQDGQMSIVGDVNSKISVVALTLVKNEFLKSNRNFNQVTNILLRSEVQEKLKNNKELSEQFSQLSIYDL